MLLLFSETGTPDIAMIVVELCEVDSGVVLSKPTANDDATLDRLRRIRTTMWMLLPALRVRVGEVLDGDVLLELHRREGCSTPPSTSNKWSSSLPKDDRPHRTRTTSDIGDTYIALTSTMTRPSWGPTEVVLGIPRRVAACANTRSTSPERLEENMEVTMGCWYTSLVAVVLLRGVLGEGGMYPVGS